MMLNARLFRDFLCLPDRVPEPFPFLRCGKDKFEFISHPVISLSQPVTLTCDRQRYTQAQHPLPAAYMAGGTQ
uniref:Uncharacterized protein n=1 Tax=Erwinia amylovora TaxID=552 RepID=Q9F7Z9_ERWAM|nr:unknown [Erwinia amylovora]